MQADAHGPVDHSMNGLVQRLRPAVESQEIVGGAAERLVQQASTSYVDLQIPQRTRRFVRATGIAFVHAHCIRETAHEAL